MLHEFEQKTNAFIKRENLLDHGSKVIVGLSGGADSVALLAALTAIGHKCVAAHCNFGPRGAEADRDQQHAMTVAESLGAEWHSVRFDTRAYMKAHGVSAEMACRDLRYQWFEQIMSLTGAQAIAVAHHRNDNVETMMLNLLRGAGVHGLRGMNPRNGHVVRPLLEHTRQDITDYLSDKGLTYVTDSSNAVNDVKRNRLRNIILPAIEREFPGAMEAICTSMANLRQNEALINETASTARQRYMPHGNRLDLRALMEEHGGKTATALLFELLYPMGFNASQVQDIVKAYGNGNSGRVFHAAGHRAMLDRGYLLMNQDSEHDAGKPVAIDPAKGTSMPICLTSTLLTPEQFRPERNAAVLYIDASAAMDKCRKWELRHWRNGDRMAPFGMRGTRKLSDIFSDAKLSIAEKERVWLLTCDDEIVWIPGLRASRLHAVTADTKAIIRLTYNPTIQTDENH